MKHLKKYNLHAMASNFCMNIFHNFTLEDSEIEPLITHITFIWYDTCIKIKIKNYNTMIY